MSTNDRSEINQNYYISDTTAVLERSPRILKHGRMFAIFDRYGDVRHQPSHPEGIFYNDTRHVSRMELLLNGFRPLMLSSSVLQNDGLLTVDLANPDFYLNGRLAMARDLIHLRRLKFLWGGVCYERLMSHNLAVIERDMTLTLKFEADFIDIFEIRGRPQARRGKTNVSKVSDREIRAQHHAADGQPSETVFRFEPRPTKIDVQTAEFEMTLGPRERRFHYMELRCRPEIEGVEETPRRCFYLNLREDRRWRRAARDRAVVIESSDNLFDETIERAVSDLYMLTTDTEYGPYPYAGIPWFSTVFGRDGIITALQSLWLDPEISRGVLLYLAATQATEENPEIDAEPGKILHETRAGEMARLGEVPFFRYYGSVDATPLFIVLAGEYLQRTGDLTTIKSLWPKIEAALNWIDEYGDIDGDGFVEYRARRPSGLQNQGWKDSDNSIFHADGELATGSISLCEVQGYVYAAKLLAASMARSLGKAGIAATLEAQAQNLKERFEKAFWCEDLSTYALALDGRKRPCRVRSSNAGHALFAGIADPERARRLADTLLDDDGFSGWGIRTIAGSEKRYNPMAYHNGSVWPHDNGLIALGLGRYGFKDHALKVFRGILDTATHMDLRRLPELFCGFNRPKHGDPTLYPVACSLQAWASSSIFALMQACLGLGFDPQAGEIRFHDPVLPEFLEELRLGKLHLGNGTVDVTLRNYNGRIAVDVGDCTGDLKVVVVHETP